MGYADLSIVQLKNFADRGDARAKEELAKRRATLVHPHKEIASPLLRRYAAQVQSAAQGAIYKEPQGR